MKLSQLLFSQGFGARRECEGLILDGQVRIAGQMIDDPFHEVDPDGLTFNVQGRDWPYRAKALIVMNKPAGTECSQKPKHHPSVYSVLPAPLRRRDVQSIGRLDEDTTGLLLFTDDGQLLHRWTSPKHHLPKVYEVGCKHAVTAEQVQRLLAGVTLIDEPDVLVRAAAAEATGERADGLQGLLLTLTEGKYHQVKRMVAAVSNRVEALHRSGFGALVLPADLAPGQWRWVEPAQVVPTAA
ncbi:MAG: 16S rRNA pseudouridine(516) synthase [Burkholderiales bacterium]